VWPRKKMQRVLERPGKLVFVQEFAGRENAPDFLRKPRPGDSTLLQEKGERSQEAKSDLLGGEKRGMLTNLSKRARERAGDSAQHERNALSRQCDQGRWEATLG